jgi:IS1 family transposase
LNVLSRDSQRMILKLMCWSSGIGDIVEVTGHSSNTVRSCLARFGEALLASHDRLVRGVAPKRLELDEIWAFIYARRESRISADPGSRPPPADFGEYYTWIAFDPDSKLLISQFTGRKGSGAGAEFFADLCPRVVSRPMISTDGFQAYADLIQRSFGADMDHVIMEKVFKGRFIPETGETTKFLVGLKKVPQNQSKVDVTLASTSLVERLNASIRNYTSRMTRRTYKFSKKFENHVHAFSIFTMWYNFVKPHAGLKGRLTPAMQAGISKTLWSYDDLLNEVDRYWEQKALRPVLQVVPEQQYTALPVGQTSDRPYFVSYSAQKREAKVHKATCRNCQHGVGRKINGGPRMNRWYAFQTEQGARRCAETLAPLQHGVCSICIVGHYAGSMVTGRGPDGRKTIS